MIKAKKKSLKTRPIVEVCSEPMMIIDETGVVTDLNAASIKIHSKTRKKLTGYLFVNLFTKPNVAKKIYSQIKRNVKVSNTPLTLVNTRNGLQQVLISGTSFKNTSSEKSEVIIVITKIDEKKNKITKEKYIPQPF